LKNVEIEERNKRIETISKKNDKLTKEIDKIFVKNIELISKSQDSDSVNVYKYLLSTSPLGNFFSTEIKDTYRYSKV
jgi:hypothetical protein